MKLFAVKVIMGLLFLTFLNCKQKETAQKISALAQEHTPQTIEMLVGTYTNGSSEGIYKYDFDTENGQILNKSLVAKVASPSYLDISTDKNVVYAIHERNPGMVTSFLWNENRTQLDSISSGSTGGAGPCFVEVNDAQNLIATANYGSGNIAVHSLKDGVIEKGEQLRQHEGNSILPNQKSPHAHSSKFGKKGNFLYVADLGIDKIISYSIDSEGTLGEIETALEMDKGDGPRHFVFHPSKDIVFIINEMSNTITSAKVNTATGKFDVIDKQSTLPEGYTETSHCADIHISSDGKFLYGSNRGHNSIATFSVSSDGELKLINTISVEGDWPRNFVISPDEKHLLVANQKSDNITVFDRDPKSGKLSYTGNQVSLSKPVCLKF